MNGRKNPEEGGDRKGKGELRSRRNGNESGVQDPRQSRLQKHFQQEKRKDSSHVSRGEGG